MQPSWMSSSFYRICEWIWRMCYVNLLWLGVTFLGLVIFGIVPATVAMLSIFRKWLMGETDIPIYRTFVDSLKKDFIKVNILAFIFAVIGYILYFNYQYLGIIEGMQHGILSIGWYLGMFLFVITLMYVFPIYVHFEMRLFQYIKTALVIALANPLALFSLLVSLGLALYLFYLVPGLIPFFGSSIIGFLIMWAAYMSIERIDRKKKKLAAKTE
ncbi:putative membrane protein YesL [Evansella vedderi]|uniref:Membrane protein YesL n=1 Tax=Evansella vedderi TaxID=38282 RepID=A0ABT9ZXE4_9BACI|nr:YesL family protein [Evansella vedderi]MDQ0255902.1 putative membrane protein YesL [Evansella vedderi]